MSTQDLQGEAWVTSASRRGVREQRKTKGLQAYSTISSLQFTLLHFSSLRYFAGFSVSLCSPNPRKSLLRGLPRRTINSQNEIQKISSRGSCSPKCAKFDDFTFFFAVNVSRCTKTSRFRWFALSSVQAAEFINQFLTTFNNLLTLVMVVFMTSNKKIGIDISKI